MTNKAEYVADVICILNRLAEQEASIILKRYLEEGGASSHTEISDHLSREIHSDYARFFDHFENNPDLCLQPNYENASGQYPGLINGLFRR